MKKFLTVLTLVAAFNASAFAAPIEVFTPPAPNWNAEFQKFFRISDQCTNGSREACRNRSTMIEMFRNNGYCLTTSKPGSGVEGFTRCPQDESTDLTEEQLVVLYHQADPLCRNGNNQSCVNRNLYGRQLRAKNRCLMQFAEGSRWATCPKP